MIHLTIDLTHKVTAEEPPNLDAIMELETLAKRCNALLAFVLKHPAMPFKTFHYVNTQQEDVAPAVHLWPNRWREAFAVFGPVETWQGPDFETSALTMKKMVDGIEVRIDGLETEAATFIREHSGRLA